jgi:uncharacterized protein with PQ loop repeat
MYYWSCGVASNSKKKAVIYNSDMNLVTILAFGLVAWLVYSMLMSYRNMEKELREIRKKCIINNRDSDEEVEYRADPVSRMKNNVIDNLQSLINYI